MLERLQWYHHFQNEVLDYCYSYRFLIDYDDTNIQLMYQDARCFPMELSDNAKRAYSVECRQKVKGQSVNLTKYMHQQVPTTHEAWHL